MTLNKPVPLGHNLSRATIRREINDTSAYLAAAEMWPEWTTTHGISRALDYLKRLELALEAEGRG